MKKIQNLNTFIPTILPLMLTSVAHAENAFEVGDYNIGVGAGGSYTSDHSAGAVGGVFANGEFTHLGQRVLSSKFDAEVEACLKNHGAASEKQVSECYERARASIESKWYLKDLTFFDARMMTFIGGGGQFGEGEVQGYFQLKLMGSLSGGMMLYQILPMNLALEDATLNLQGTQVRGSALLGTSVVLPVNLIAGMDQKNIYVSVTAGMRMNSDLARAGFGIQPKIRFMSDNTSIEAKALLTVGSDETERKASVVAAINHVFTQGDQIGIMGSYDQILRAAGDENSGGEILIFYGKNL